MRKLLSALAIAGIASSAGFTFSEASAQSREVTPLKNPGCQCCDGYANYLRHTGFSVTVKPTHDIAQQSRAAIIPADFQCCTLSKTAGSVAKRHVPVTTAQILCTTRPALAGTN